MNSSDKWLLVTVLCGAAATCVVAGLLTHNRASTPLSLADVLITAIIPVGLLGYVTLHYRSKRVVNDDSTETD